MSGGAATAQPVAAPPPPAEPGRWRRNRVTIAFLAPAAILLGVWIVYPTIYTIVRSFLDRDGSQFIWFDNYQELFTQDTLTTAIKNNVLWLAIVPALVTAIGLVFAVLLERVRWSVVFKTVVFMPMAISLFAAGVIWRVMYEKDPEIGAVNASLNVVADTFDPPGALSDAQPATDDLTGSPQQGSRCSGRSKPATSRGSGSPGSRRTRFPRAPCRPGRPRPRRARSMGSSGGTSSPEAASPASWSGASSGCPG